MRHTWSEWSLITAAVICRVRLSSRDRSLPHACTLVSSWVQEGSVEGSSAAPVRRPSGQDAGPTSPVERRGPRGRRSRWRSRRPSRPGPQRGVRAAAGLRPLPGPFLPEHSPPSQPSQHDEDTRSPVYFGHFIPFGHYFIICLIKASPRPDATPTVSVVCSSRHNIHIHF